MHAPTPEAPLLLSREDVRKLMRPADYLKAVEAGFRAAKEGNASSPPPLHLESDNGGFHAKGAILANDRRAYAAVKVNANFPGNPAIGLPTIQGVILLFDADSGAVLAVIDSIEITLGRTAAATALAARYLARTDARTLCVVGCGEQAIAHVAALREVLPIALCVLVDSEAARAERLAATIKERFALDARAESDAHHAASAADVIVTLTPARSPILARSDVRDGTFIAAVGADAPHKNEIEPALLAASRLFVDTLDQCRTMGDLRHAIAAGVVAPDHVQAELADLVTGNAVGRTSEKEITLFDSTGTALQDVATAAMAYERASPAGVGMAFDLRGKSRER